MKFLHIKRRGVLVALFAIGGIVALGLGGCPKGGVTIDKYSIQFHPQTKITPEDQRKMEAILNASDRKDLYEIRTVGKNRETHTIGKLKEGYIDQALAAEIAHYPSLGHPNVSMQVGIWGHPEVHVSRVIEGKGTPTPRPPTKHGNASGHPTVHTQEWVAAAKLVEEIAPIVEKYRHDKEE